MTSALSDILPNTETTWRPSNLALGAMTRINKRIYGACYTENVVGDVRDYCYYYTMFANYL